MLTRSPQWFSVGKGSGVGLAYRLATPVIRFETHGDVAYRDGLAVLRNAFATAAAQPDSPTGGWDLLFDTTHSEEDRETSELRGTAAVIAEHRATLSGRCVVIATDPLHYGLSRMFTVFMESLGFEAYVARSADEAEQWLVERRAVPS